MFYITHKHNLAEVVTYEYSEILYIISGHFLNSLYNKVF
jgi:hypothetical protein